MSKDTNVEQEFKDIDSLPDELKEQLSKSLLKGVSSDTIFLDKLRPIMETPKSIDDIIIGWWQTYDKTIIKRQQTAQKINKLVKSGLMIKVSSGVFALPPEDENAKK